MATQQFCRAWWQPAILAVLVSLACSDPTGTSATSSSPASDPVLAAALKVTMTGAAADQLAYVALDPGTITAGTAATVTDRASAVERTAPVVNGGFDPVSIPASAGDTLVVSVATATGRVVVASVVARPHPPHVVRVDPPKDQVDVPVNTSLTVVFNEPVSAGSITAATMQLHQGTTTVAGTITVDPATPWLVTFTPNQPLDPGATYTFTVSGSIADPSGLTLDSPATISFATEAPFATVVVSPQSGIFSGQIQLTATAKDAAGHALTDQAFVWTTSNPGIATVTSSGLVTGSQSASGNVVITATTSGGSGDAVLLVVCSTSCMANGFGPGTHTVTGTISKLLADGTTQPVPNAYLWGWVQFSKLGTYAIGEVRADANGVYHVQNVADGVVMITADFDGMEQPCMATASTVGQGTTTLNVTVVDPATPEPPTIASPAVTGTVYRMINGVKTPLAGAVVQFGSWVSDQLLAETVSDANGHYALCNLLFTFPGTGGNIYATAAEHRNEYQSAAWATVTVTGPGTVDIVVP